MAFPSYGTYRDLLRATNPFAVLECAGSPLIKYQDDLSTFCALYIGLSIALIAVTSVRAGHPRARDR